MKWLRIRDLVVVGVPGYLRPEDVSLTMVLALPFTDTPHRPGDLPHVLGA